MSPNPPIHPEKFPLVRVATVVALAATLGGIVANVARPLGLRIAGTSDDVVALEAKLSASIARDSTMVAWQEKRLRRLEDNFGVLTYLVCVQTRRTDPAAVPSQCNPVHPQ